MKENDTELKDQNQTIQEQRQEIFNLQQNLYQAKDQIKFYARGPQGQSFSKKHRTNDELIADTISNNIANSNNLPITRAKHRLIILLLFNHSLPEIQVVRY